MLSSDFASPCLRQNRVTFSALERAKARCSNSAVPCCGLECCEEAILVPCCGLECCEEAVPVALAAGQLVHQPLNSLATPQVTTGGAGQQGHALQTNLHVTEHRRVGRFFYPAKESTGHYFRIP